MTSLNCKTKVLSVEHGIMVLLVSVLLGCSQAPPTERRLFTLPKDAIQDIMVSEDGTHWCYQTKTDNRIRVEGDSNYASSDYDRVGAMWISARSGRCGFWALGGGAAGRGVLLVVDGTEYETRAQSEGFFLWSPNGKHWIALWAEPTEEGKAPYVVMFDGKEVGRYENAKSPVFSTDSEHFGFLMTEGDAVGLVIDGSKRVMGHSKQISSGFGHASPLSFMKDGKVAAIVPRSGTQGHPWGDSWAVTKADEVVASYPTRLILITQGATLIKLGGSEGAEGDETLPVVAPLSLTVNEAGGVLGWWARPGAKGTKWYCYVDGKQVGSGHESPPVDEGGLYLSPDGRRVAWREKVYEGETLKSASVAVDGRMGRAYEWVGGITFSGNSSRHAYWAKRIGGKGYIYVVDDKEVGTEFEDVTNFVFSADSRDFAYIGKRGQSLFLVVNGNEHEMLCDKVLRLRLLENGRPAMIAQSGREVVLFEGIPAAKERKQ
jgi:hypothetical protein